MKPAWNVAAASSGNGRGAVKVYPSESSVTVTGKEQYPSEVHCFYQIFFPLFMSVDRYAGSCWVMPKNSSGLGMDSYFLLASPLEFFEVTVNSRGSREKTIGN
jgi:hypothetical protein